MTRTHQRIPESLRAGGEVPPPDAAGRGGGGSGGRPLSVRARRAAERRVAGGRRDSRRPQRTVPYRDAEQAPGRGHQRHWRWRKGEADTLLKKNKKIESSR